MPIIVVPAFNEEANVPNLHARPRRCGPSCGDDGHIILVDDGSTDCDRRGGEGPRRRACRWRCSSRAATRARARAFDAGFRRALELAGDGRPDHHDGVRHDERPRRARGRCSPSPMTAPTSCSPPTTPAASWPTCRATGASCRRPPRRRSARGAGLNASTVSSFFRVYRATCCAPATRSHGDNLIRERGFACKAELLIKLSRMGAQRGRGPRDARLVQARGREQAARAADDGRLRADDDPPGRQPKRLRMSVGIVGGGLLGLDIAHQLAPAGVEVELYEADKRLGGLAGSTKIGGVAVDRYYHAVTTTDDKVVALAESLGLSIRWRPLGVGFYHDGRRCVDVHAQGGADLPGPAARRQGAARRVRPRAAGGSRTTRRSTSSRSRRGRASSAATGCGSACGRRCWTRSSTAATTTCPRPTCGRACAARPARAPRAGARSWARSRAATRRSSTGSRSASARSAATSTRRRRSATSPRRPPAGRWAWSPTQGLREHDTVVTTQLRPNLRGHPGARARGRARPRPAALHGHRLPGRARQAQRQPVLRDQHHRPPRADHERGRDDARRRPGVGRAAT